MGYSIIKDVENRIEWIDKRIALTNIQKEYIKFQMKEAVVSALREIGKKKIK